MREGERDRKTKRAAAMPNLILKVKTVTVIGHTDQPWYAVEDDSKM